MNFSLYLANRYIRSKKGARFLSLISVITITGIALGVTVLIMAISILNGFEQTVSENIIKFNAHLNISGFSSKYLTDFKTTTDKIKENLDNEYSSISPYISKKVIISKKNIAEGIIVSGIDSAYADFSLKRIIIEGNQNIGKNSSGIVLGKKLADKLNAEINDKITIFALSNNEIPSVSNFPIVEQFNLIGIYESGMAEYDDIYAFINFDIAFELFEMNDEITGYNINLNDINKIDSAKKQLSELLPYYYVRSYRDINKHIFTWLELQQKPIPIVLGLIIIVAIFNIVGALLMLIVQKTEAIGVLKSLGTTSRQITQIFVLQGTFLALIGIFIGNTLAFVLSWLQNEFKIIELPEQIYYLSSVPIHVDYSVYFIVSIIALLLALFASFIPSFIASKIQPITAIKFS